MPLVHKSLSLVHNICLVVCLWCIIFVSWYIRVVRWYITLSGAGGAVKFGRIFQCLSFSVSVRICPRAFGLIQSIGAFGAFKVSAVLNCMASDKPNPGGPTGQGAAALSAQCAQCVCVYARKYIPPTPSVYSPSPIPPHTFTQACAPLPPSLPAHSPLGRGARQRPGRQDGQGSACNQTSSTSRAPRAQPKWLH